MAADRPLTRIVMIGHAPATFPRKRIVNDFTSRGNAPPPTPPVISLLRVVITQHLHAIQLRSGQGLLVSNSRWLHGRDRYTKAQDTEVLFTGRQALRGGTGYVSDYLGLLARLNCLGT